MAKTRLLVETVLYGAGTFRRFTQDSPIMPEVWANFLERPRERIQLLIEPWLDTPPSEIAVALRARLKIDPEKDRDASKTIYNRTLVVSDLTLQEVVKHVIPLTYWYHDLEAVAEADLPESGGSQAIEAAELPKPRTPDPDELWEDIIHPATGNIRIQSCSR